MKTISLSMQSSISKSLSGISLSKCYSHRVLTQDIMWVIQREGWPSGCRGDQTQKGQAWGGEKTSEQTSGRR